MFGDPTNFSRDVEEFEQIEAEENKKVGKSKKVNEDVESFEIHFDDLSDEAKKEFLEFQGMKDPSEGNFDVLPIAIVDKEVEGGEVEESKEVKESSDVSKDVKELIKQAKTALDAGDYTKAADLAGRLSQIQQTIPDGVEAKPPEAEVVGENKSENNNNS